MDEQANIKPEPKEESKADRSDRSDRRTITSRANMAKARAAKIEQMKKAREAELELAWLKKEKEKESMPPKRMPSPSDSDSDSESDSSDGEPVLVIRQHSYSKNQRPSKLLTKAEQNYSKSKKVSKASRRSAEPFDIDYEQIADRILPEIVERVKLAKKARSAKKMSKPLNVKDSKKQLSSGKVEDWMMTEFLRTIHRS